MDEKNKKKPKQKKEKVEEESEEKKSKKEEKPKEETEKQKKEKERKKKHEDLKKKYGVMKEIPKQKIKDEKKTEEVESKESKDEIASLTDLVLKTEKLDGKLDVVSGYKDDLNERIAQISEEIGELRSMIMETDRSFGKIEKSFEEIRGVVGDVEPLKVKKGFEKKEQEIMENRVKIEKIENLVKALEKESENYRKIMEKIKSFENLVEISEKIDKKISSIEETKKYSDRTAAKVESIFSEVTDKVNELEKQKEKILKVDELTTEITQMLDEISIKMKGFAKTKEVKDFQEEVKKEIESISESKNRIEEVGKLLKETQIDEKLLEVGKVKSGINNLEKKVKNFSSELDNRKKEFKENKDKINDLEKLNSELLNRMEKTSKTLEKFKVPVLDGSKRLKEIEDKIKNLDKQDLTVLSKNVETINKKLEDVVDYGTLKKVVKTLEEDYQKIKENRQKILELNESFSSTKKNMGELKKVEKRLKDFKNLEKIASNLEKRVSQIDELKEIPAKMVRIKKIVEKQNNVISDIIGNMERVKSIPDINIEELNNIDLSLRFYQLLNILPFLDDKVKLKEYSEEMKSIIKKMRESGSWNPKKEKFMNDLLKISKKISRPVDQNELLEKVGKLATWTSNMTDEIKGRKEFEGQVEKDLENIKKSLKTKVDSSDVEDVYLVERELMELTGKFKKLKSVMERQNSVVNELVEKVKETGEEYDKEKIKALELSNRFYQILSIYPYVKDKQRLKDYSVELNQTIEELKIAGVWNKEKEKFMKDMIETNKRLREMQEKRNERLNDIKTQLVKFTDKSDFKDFKGKISEDIKRINSSLRDKVGVESMDNLLLVDQNLLDLTGKVEKLKSVVEKQNIVIDNLITKVEEREVEGIDKRSVKDLKTTVRFYQLLTMLPYVIEPSRIKSYLIELKDIIDDLKANNQWSAEKERFMKNFLGSLSDSYKSRGYEEIGKAYGELA